MINVAHGFVEYGMRFDRWNGNIISNQLKIQNGDLKVYSY